MKTLNLNKTNLQSTFPNTSIEEVESILGKEIESVYTYKNSPSYNMIMPDETEYSYLRKFRPFFKNSSIKIDRFNKKIEVTGRRKWARIFETKTYELEIIGYKLLTTSLNEGFIYQPILK